MSRLPTQTTRHRRRRQARELVRKLVGELKAMYAYLEDRTEIKKREDKVAMEVSVDARDKASLVKTKAKVDDLKALKEEVRSR